MIMNNELRPMWLRTLGYEGGYTEADGIPTNYGVNQKTYDSWRSQKGLAPKSVKEINANDSYVFYDDEFYKRPKYDKLPEDIQFNMFDMGVNISPKRATELLQGVVGSKVDGTVGKNTRKAVKAYIDENGANELNVELLRKRQEYYNTLADSNPEKAIFLNGWTNRVNDILKDYISEEQA